MAGYTDAGALACGCSQALTPDMEQAVPTTKKHRNPRRLPRKERGRPTSHASTKNLIPRDRLVQGMLSLEHTPTDLVAIVRNNALESPLLRLPGEIRNKIYHYVVCGHTTFFYGTRYQHRERGIECPRPSSKVSSQKYHAFGHTFALTRVCRQIYHDTRTLVYSGNTFEFQKFKFFYIWLKHRRPLQQSAITSLKVTPEVVNAFEKKTGMPFSASFPDLNEVVLVGKPLCLWGDGFRDLDHVETRFIKPMRDRCTKVKEHLETQKELVVKMDYSIAHKRIESYKAYYLRLCG